MKLFNKFGKLLACMLVAMPFVACDDDNTTDIPADQMIVMSEINTSISINYDETFASTTFLTHAVWSAELEEAADWVTILSKNGTGGPKQTLRLETKVNRTPSSRSAVIVINCYGVVKKVTLTQAGSTLTNEEIDPETIENYDMFYYPGSQPEYFTSKESLLKVDSKYNWKYMKQSKHFFCFWDTRFTLDPNGDDVPEWAKVDIDDLLEKAEHFYQTNVETLKMTTVGKGKSMLDNYKMQIWLIYDEGWTATGSGWGEIGALWVTPSTCKPVGSVIAHEIGHSFQFQVGADRAYATGEDVSKFGFRYGFGNGGGCTYWEQCAQWQSMQDYPAEQFWQDFNPWLVNYYRHFNHEWMRYQSYWLQSYWVEKHGVEAFGRIWSESNYPDDPIECYVRLYCGGDWQKFWDEYYDYASRMVTYDIDNVRQYRNGTWGLSSQYKTSLFTIGDLEYQVAYASCPETSGFNIIRLNVPAGGGKVSVDLTALPVGAPLAEGDNGAYKQGDNEAYAGYVSTYNNNPTNNGAADFRFGFVSCKGGNPTYSDMTHAAQGTATFVVPADAEELYLVVAATPEKYNQHKWDVDDLTDDQWPYTIKLSGTDLFGNMIIDPNNEPENLDLTYDLTCDAELGDYVQGTVSLDSNGALAQLAQAFVLQPAEIAAITIAPQNGQTGAPAEGNIVFGLMQANNKIGYNYTANAGFYINADGSVGNWADNSPIWVEYDKDNFVLTYGHKPGASTAGTKYTVKPCLVYTKDGKQYVATFTLNLQF